MSDINTLKNTGKTPTQIKITQQCKILEVKFLACTCTIDDRLKFHEHSKIKMMGSVIFFSISLCVWKKSFKTTSANTITSIWKWNKILKKKINHEERAQQDLKS